MVPTSTKHDKITFNDVLESINTYIEDEEQISIIKKAYNFANKKHLALDNEVINLLIHS